MNWLEHNKNYPPYITIVPPEICLAAWRQDYQDLQQHFIHGSSLSFDDLLKRMGILQQRLQKTV